MTLWLVGTLGVCTGGGSLFVHVISCSCLRSSCFRQVNLHSYRHLRTPRKGPYYYCSHRNRHIVGTHRLLNTFSRSPLDRLNNHRNQASLLEECENSSQVRYIIFYHREPLLKVVTEQAPSEKEPFVKEQAHIAWFTREHGLVEEILAKGRQALLLGKWTSVKHAILSDENVSSDIYDKYCFVLDATGIWNSDQISQIGAQPMNIRSLLYKIQFDPQEAAVLAHAQSLLEFHVRHQYCGKCGALTELGGLGSKRVCSAGCGMEWFPRSDPVIIVAVVKNGHLLMGRQPSWPLGRYSVIAGFMEHGESIEDAIYREVKEETFIQVGRCRYHSSQPWPFPYSLMLGFVAEASSQTIQVDKQELDDAKWFSREQVQQMLSNRDPNGLRGPPPQSIAYELCHAFVNGDEICNF
ncbi:Peroxisomal NADH pyrophosphatase NUDT12 [Galdieria sulphuraria]|nr:Peroxisomal NADH pyrophosphatase NUDT12 [Galdieria sulphuraria]